MRTIVVLAALLALVSPARAATASGKPSDPPRGWLGITLAKPDLLDRDESAGDDADTPESDDAAAADVPARGAEPAKEIPKGALVTAIVRDGPADRAGFRSGDVIHRIGNTEVATPDDLMQAVAKAAPGDWVDVAFARQGKDRSVSVRLGLRSDDTRLDLRRPYAGFTGIDVPVQLRRFWGGSEKQGVLLGEVATGGPAARAGLQPGDLVLSVEGKPVGSVGQLISRIQLGGIGNTIGVAISRQGTHLDVALELEDQPQKILEPRVNPVPSGPRRR